MSKFLQNTIQNTDENSSSLNEGGQSISDPSDDSEQKFKSESNLEESQEQSQDEDIEEDDFEEEGEFETSDQDEEQQSNSNIQQSVDSELGSSSEDESPSLQKLNPKIPTQYMERQNWVRLIVILEQANLQTCKTARGIELLNCDDHQKIIQKMGKKYEEFRPDVTHQCLLALLDTPLNKAGLLQVYIRSEEGVLIEINPMLKVPRTFKRFSYFMAQLLTKLKVRSQKGSATLATVIKNPIQQYLPMNVKCVGTSKLATLVNLNKYVQEIGVKKKPLVFVIGAVSIGNPGMENDLGLDQENISISKFGLSAACVCGKICNAMEKLWEVV